MERAQHLERFDPQIEPRNESADFQWSFIEKSVGNYATGVQHGDRFRRGTYKHHKESPGPVFLHDHPEFCQKRMCSLGKAVIGALLKNTARGFKVLQILGKVKLAFGKGACEIPCVLLGPAKKPEGAVAMNANEHRPLYGKSGARRQSLHRSGVEE